MKSVIGITMGDPTGIGPELLLKLLLIQKEFIDCRFLVFADYSYLNRSKVHFRIHLDLNGFSFVEPKNKCLDSLVFGVPTSWGGRVSGECVETAVSYAKEGLIDALVTLPINKVAFKMGGWGSRFPGHTEMLASLCGIEKVALMLTHGPLRAIHVTQHIALAHVSKNLSIQRVMDTIALAHEGLIKMGFKRPRIAVCGFNPHAGDGGLFGQEEKKIISPAVKKCQKIGIKVDGPLSADSVWPKVLSKQYDVGVAMYHDQGQIPVKLAGTIHRGPKSVVHGVNITLGLPIIRTSVAHGTAYDIAGKGVASIESFVDAVQSAIAMVK